MSGAMPLFPYTPSWHVKEQLNHCVFYPVFLNVCKDKRVNDKIDSSNEQCEKIVEQVQNFIYFGSHI